MSQVEFIRIIWNWKLGVGIIEAFAEALKYLFSLRDTQSALGPGVFLTFLPCYSWEGGPRNGTYIDSQEEPSA